MLLVIQRTPAIWGVNLGSLGPWFSVWLRDLSAGWCWVSVCFLLLWQSWVDSWPSVIESVLVTALKAVQKQWGPQGRVSVAIPAWHCSANVPNPRAECDLNNVNGSSVAETIFPRDPGWTTIGVSPVTKRVKGRRVWGKSWDLEILWDGDSYNNHVELQGDVTQSTGSPWNVRSLCPSWTLCLQEKYYLCHGATWDRAWRSLSTRPS